MERMGAPSGLDRGLQAGLAAFRAAAWLWLAVVTAAERDRLDRPGVAAALLAAALAATVAGAAGRLAWPVEVAVAAALLAADRHVYDGDHPQTFGGAWPVAAALAAGLATGPLGGALAGSTLGVARWAGSEDAAGVSLVSSGVLYALAGGVAGYLAQRLRRAETEVAAARAREEVARTLHDGVLQTLAVVQRRAEDPDLVRLAREQERDLRDWLFGDRRGSERSVDLAAALREVAARVEDRDGLRATVVVDTDVPGLPPEAVDAIAGAVGEALTNAAKHGRARKATVYAEPADDAEGGRVFCSVKDDGDGFDPVTTREGVGTSRSIRGRIGEAGGRVEIDGNPGHGTEVRIWL
jgi:signal transduction histidine kinase